MASRSPPHIGEDAKALSLWATPRTPAAEIVRRTARGGKRAVQPRTFLFEPTFLARFDRSFVATLASRSMMARPSFAGFYVEQVQPRSPDPRSPAHRQF